MSRSFTKNIIKNEDHEPLDLIEMTAKKLVVVKYRASWWFGSLLVNRLSLVETPYHDCSYVVLHQPVVCVFVSFIVFPRLAHNWYPSVPQPVSPHLRDVHDICTLDCSNRYYRDSLSCDGIIPVPSP